MYLVDCFIPAMTYVIETLDTVTPDRDLDYGSFRQQIIQLLREHEDRTKFSAYSEDDINNALFAVVTFIDEKVMNSQWRYKAQWGAELLQRHFFNTTRGGLDFFNRLDALNPYNPVERDVREVYFYCLALGFAGKYYRPGDRAQLTDLIAANADILCVGIKTETLLDATGPGQATEKLLPARRHMSRTPFYIGIPVLLLLGLFMFFRHGILSAVNELLMTI